MTAKDERRAQLEAELAALDDDDGSDEVTITHEGRSFTGTWRRAVGVAKSWGFTLVPDAPEPEADDKPKEENATVKRFQSGRRIG